jgi:hypothetical protein
MVWQGSLKDFVSENNGINFRFPCWTLYKVNGFLVIPLIMDITLLFADDITVYMRHTTN